MEIFIETRDAEYLRWKRKNVTYRGIKSASGVNEVYGSFGKGLYTAFLGNKSMAKQYGEVHFVVGAIPKNPKKVQNLNSAEIWVQQLVSDFCRKHNKEYSREFFEANTSIEREAMQKGFDGLIIVGREMVHYKPTDVLYFKTEEQLENYYYMQIAKRKG